jgi:hypothetical protein
MRKITVLCVMLAMAATMTATAQRKHARHKASHEEVKAPDAVRQAFSQNFAEVSSETWHKMASGNWYADFAEDSLEAKAEFTPEGAWVATRTALSPSQLPDTVNTAIRLQFPSAAVSGVTRIQRADVPSYYRIILQTNAGEKQILANDKGVITE